MLPCSCTHAGAVFKEESGMSEAAMFNLMGGSAMAQHLLYVGQQRRGEGPGARRKAGKGRIGGGVGGGEGRLRKS